jgi:hypothetical protein
LGNWVESACNCSFTEDGGLIEMKRRELAHILSAHADGLIRGKDTADQFLADYPDAAAELGPLFHLAASIQAALIPVKAPITFVNRLRRDLMAFAPSHVVVKAPVSGQKILLMGVAAAGSVLSVTGLVFLVSRRLKTSGKAGQQTVTAV